MKEDNDGVGTPADPKVLLSKIFKHPIINIPLSTAEWEYDFRIWQHQIQILESYLEENTRNIILFFQINCVDIWCF